MPPVFNPRSPSSARLWSCEVGKIFAVVPSHKRVQRDLHALKKFLHHDLRVPAAPKALLTRISSMARSASA